MIDLYTEELLTISQAARRYPGGGKHVSQIHRYRMDKHGAPLECLMVGKRWMTSVEAMHRHVHACTAEANGQPIRAAGQPVTAQRKAARRQAERELVAAGI